VTLERTLTEIDHALNRLACVQIVEGTVGGQAVTVALEAHAATLAGWETPAARDLAGTLRTLAASGASEEDKLSAALAVVGRFAGASATCPDATADHGQPVAEPDPARDSGPGTRGSGPEPRASSPEPLGAEDDLTALQGDAEMAELFIGEALDHLGTIESKLLALEEHPGDNGLLNDIFRPFHTIKGNAGALGLLGVQAVAHTVETLLDLARSGRYRIGQTEVDLVLRAVDVLTLMINDIGRRLEGAPPAALGDAAASLVESVKRVIEGGEDNEWGRLQQASTAGGPQPVHGDGATSTPGPLCGPQPAQDSRLEPHNGLSDARRWDDVPGHGAIKVETRKLDGLVDAIGELMIVQSLIQEDPALAAVIDGRLARNLAQLKRITTDLQRNAMALRTVPIRQAFRKVERVVRDMSRKLDKPIELTLSGEDTELDRKVVEEITDPLMHMVRNSVDHGIEPPDVREARGKRAQATVSLSAYHQGGQIVIEISDDGAGLDTERIRGKAVERGLLAPHATATPDEIHSLIFAPGFSTADTVTEISGRGVGMDVVRRNIEALRGRVEIRTERGRGTTFAIKLPLTLAVVDGLLVAVGRERYVLPTTVVRESMRPTPSQVHTVQGQPRMLQVRDTLLPLVSLGDLFGIDAIEDPAEATVVVIEVEGSRVGLVVDDLLTKQEVVIKTLGETFSTVRGIAGGAILHDGRVGLILDAHGIIELMRGAHAA
jgi:two-component system chemotaxis sensor kinase CheA